MTDLPATLRDTLERFGQTHVLQFWSELNEAQRLALIHELNAVDFELVQNLFSAPAEEVDWGEVAARAEPPTAIRLDTGRDKALQAEALALGEDSLRRGEVAVVIVAGGQGTRLGFDKPKGLYPIGPVSGRTLFQVLFDSIQARAQRYGAAIPVLLMTSPATHDDTAAYLSQENRFGFAEEDLTLFCQGTLPAVDRESGKVLLASKYQLALSPDGHGGMLAALDRSGSLEKLIQRGIKYLYYCQVDNPLAQVASPELLGFHRFKNSELTTQVVKKVDAVERVGNVVDVDGQLRIIEYSDLPEEVARQTDQEGRLKLWAGNIAIHVFDIEFLQRVKDSPSALPFHTAIKKVPFVNSDGDWVEPASPNGMKFEKFIFDLLPQAKNALAVEAEKATAFAPVKNANNASSDTPALAKQAMSDLAKQWLQSVDAKLNPASVVEINPRFALDPEELRTRLKQDLSGVSEVYLDI